MQPSLDILSLPLADLQQFFADLGEPRYRAKQVFTWLHQRGAVSFDEMTDLSLALRGKLAEKCYIHRLRIDKKLVSAVDGTVKYLYALADGERVEAVRMQHRHGISLCISTQVGCRMGCRFCASTLGGLQRNLTAAEMLGQVYHTETDTGETVGSVVLMGIGEPLDNLDNVLDFLSILSAPEGRGLGLRNVSLSTCGLVDQMERLAAHRLPLTLSVSLHAPDDETRSAIMPVNKRWPVSELLQASRRYFDATGRRVTFEYALIAGKNDSPDQARQLARLLAATGMPCHVNLIPINPVDEYSHRRSDAESIRRFQQILQEHHVAATLRRELGSDITAACGQLRVASGDRQTRVASGDRQTRA